MYLSEKLIRHLCKNNVGFQVNYEATDDDIGSTLASIQIDSKNEIIIKPVPFEIGNENNYILVVDGEEEQIKLLETLLVRLLDLKVLPENAYF